VNKLVKVAVGAAMVSMVGGVSAGGSTVTTSYVNLWALVAPTCSLNDVFLTDVDLSTQIDADGAIGQAAPVVPFPITTGMAITCSGTPSATTLNMVSQNHGIKSGAIILPYDIDGNFGQDIGPADITISTFNSATGPASDLLVGTGVTPVSTPALTVALNDQTTVGTAQAGNYADTLTVVVNVTSP
jgi:spore coat protein U-like protein